MDGSCRVGIPGTSVYLCRRPPGGYKPLHHSCQAGNNYAKGYSTSLPYLRSSMIEVSVHLPGLPVCLFGG